MGELEIRKLIGEVLIVGFAGGEPNDAIHTLIEDYYVRNIILFTRNIHSMEQLGNLTGKLQELARRAGAVDPLIICTDQENGVVRRLSTELPGLPGNMALGAAGDLELAREVGRVTAEQLLFAGVNMNLAPVLDVNNNAHNPVIGVRSFGEDPHRVGAFAAQMVLGLQEGGVIACGKHFPGHGDTQIDSHHSLPIIKHTRSRLDAVELVPFRQAIRAGIDTIMSAHVMFPTLEPRPIPTTMSAAVLTGLLRNELGFDGVILTDCLEMDAIAKTVGVAQGAVRALAAGADMLLISHRLDRQLAAIEAIVQAVVSGTLPGRRLREAAARVRVLRHKRLTRTYPATSLTQITTETGDLQRKIAHKAVTLGANQFGLIPVQKDISSITVLLDPMAPVMAVAEAFGAERTLPQVLRRQFPTATVEVFEIEEGSVLSEAVLTKLQASCMIIAGIHGLNNPTFREAVDGLCKQGFPVIAIALQSPYDLSGFRHLHTALVIYENTPWMMEAGVRALTSKHIPGRLPIRLQQEKSR